MLLHVARRFAGSASWAVSAGGPNKATVAYGRLLPAGRGVSTQLFSTIGSHMSDNDPAALTHHKEKALKGESPTFVPEVEGWHETLASVSEAVVKAERYVDPAAACDPEKLEQLQKHTIQVVQQLHHTGEDGMPETPKRHEHDVSGSPAHTANLEHTRSCSGTDPR